ncbi:MAG: hypothetical protein LBD11_02005 [Candidatus Peribacteria bacterium]|jgi:hypothetical protein|nr:hypothetical protein [Candidatus Peribacteria bacterium]
MKLTTEEIVMFQIYGNVFFDEAILVDGIEGTQTKDVGNILTKQGTLSERAKEWKEKAEANQKEKATLNAQSSKEISKTSFKSPLQSVNIPALLEHNPALKHLVANTGEKAEEAIQTIQQVFSYLTNYLDTTTPEQKNFLQDFTIDFTKGIHVVGSKIEITGFMKNGAYKDTPISFSYDMDSRNFAINTLLEQNANSNTFNINPTHPNKILFQLPQNLDTSKGTRPLDISPITQHNIELNIEKNRAISTMLDLFYLERQPPEYTKKDSK